MSDILKAEAFHGTVDSYTPLFNRDPGWLKTLSNMRVKPGGWLEARGGQQSLRPSGGTAAAVDSSGWFSGFHQYTSPYGVMIGTVNNGTTFSRNVAPRPAFRIFGNATNLGGDYPVVGTNDSTTNNWWAFGSTSKFGRIEFNLIQGTGGGSAYSVTWEYWNGTIWTALTGPTEDFKTAGVRSVTWTIPSAWVPTTLVGDTANNIGGYYLYFIRVRTSTIGASVADAWNGVTPILSDWDGHRKVFSGINGRVSGSLQQSSMRVYGQNAAGLALWILPASSDFAGWASNFTEARFSHRFLDYQGTLLRPTHRFDGLSGWRPLGFAAPSLTVSAATATASETNFGQACRFTYFMTFGYGPGGSWGEGPPVPIGGATPLLASTAYAAGDQAVLTWTFTANALLNHNEASQIHIYRSQDETGAIASARGSLPGFRITTLDRGVGVDTAGLPVTYTDSSYALPVPAPPMDISDRTPPARCRFINELGGRVLLASNDEFPNRGWYSLAGEGEAFDQDEAYIELKKPITGSVVAFDTWFLWSEDEMIAVSDLNEQVPNIFEVEGGVGCVAGNGAHTRYGVVMWPYRDGIYLMGQDLKPHNVTPDHQSVFGKMSVETHGGSEAKFYDSMYDIHLLSPDGVAVGAAPRWRFDLLKPHWHQVSITGSPLATIVAPFGHADSGVEHPIFGSVDRTTSDRIPYVGEYTTADSGTGFDCIADIHFGPGKFQKFSPLRFAAYYQADSGWGTPVISTPPGSVAIFKTPAGFGTPTPKSGTDYKLAVANCTENSSGAQDIAVRFKATTVDGGTVRNQRLAACYLDGKLIRVHPTA